MMPTIEDTLFMLIYYLYKSGLLDIDRFKAMIDGIGSKIFVCTSFKLDYDEMARSLREGPILLECSYSRAHMATKYLSRRIGEPVRKRLAGRKFQPIYILYLDRHRDMVTRIIREISK